ncbi:MAG TPA: DMT family transporter [Acidimicrobiia bacterium]
MNAGVLWSLLAALGFGFTQTLNRKSNLLVGAFRTAFGLLVSVEVFLVVRLFVTGEHRLLAEAPPASLGYFSASALIHYILGWTLLALSQHQIGVARTGAVTSAAPLVGTLLAAPVLGERLTLWTLVGVTASVIGVALVSVSRVPVAGGGRWMFPGFGLAVALCWGTSPMFIRKGLEGIDEPLLGLTVGLGVALVVHAAGLTLSRSWDRPSWNPRAVLWMVLGGVTGAVGIGAQWVAFGLTTIAIAITVQQLATLVVVALAPIMFDATFERINVLLLTGTAAMLAGSAIVVLAGRA